MNRIEFSHNWNGKLFLDTFGTVRMSNGEKYFVGNEMEAYLKNLYLGIVKVAAVRTFQFRQTRDVLAFLDTGKPAHYMASILNRMYGNLSPDQPLDHVVLTYVKRDIETQTSLITEWWQSKKQTAA